MFLGRTGYQARYGGHPDEPAILDIYRVEYLVLVLVDKGTNQNYCENHLSPKISLAKSS